MTQSLVSRRLLLGCSALVPILALARPTRATAFGACGFDPLPTQMEFAVDAAVFVIGGLTLLSAPAVLSVTAVAGAAVLLTGARMFQEDLASLTECNVKFLDHMIKNFK